ncbi:MAG: hypothetical protein IKU32_02285 [Clostridia bacterium]|nr:hypothetical protein [Clostridia bacterium]
MADKDTMTTIYEGLNITPSPGNGAEEFVGAIQSLYDEFKTAYTAEWDRLNDNEKMYQAKHWDTSEAKVTNANEPQPVTPIIFSTVENVKSDLIDEMPEAVIMPESTRDEVACKVLTRVVAQNHEAFDYPLELFNLTHDLLVGGYMIQEVGWDKTMHNGMGGVFIRHVSNKNIMFDPLVANIQDGRAVFKIERLPTSWFQSHYPEYAEHFSGGTDLVPNDHFAFGNVDSKEQQYMILLEVWIRTFDPENQRYSVHMVHIAGGQLLENSCVEKPEGYFYHGEYPFVVTPLYPIKGSSLGHGIVDMFKNPQLYADKLNQIILKNALMSGRTRILIRNGAADLDQIRDFSQEVVEVNDLNGINWFQDKTLPGYLITHMMNMQQAIKEEAGSNDFSRGNTTGGVTAASAITALQEASSKRSRMESQVIYSGFKKAVRMELEVEREFEFQTRRVEITVNGEKKEFSVSEAFFQNAMDGYDKLPVEFIVSVKPMRESRFTKLSNNELILQIMTMHQGKDIDTAILMEAMDFEGKDLILEKLRAAQAQSKAQLMAQLADSEARNRQLTDENNAMNGAVNEMQMALGGGLNMDGISAEAF